MQDKYVLPEFEVRAFHCPLCHVYAAQHWSTLLLGSQRLGLHVAPVHAGYCGHCAERHYWLKFGDNPAQMVYPEHSIAPPPHPLMPDTVRADYLEAASVIARSPRSAAALLRLALQKLMIELGLPGKKIDADIGELVARGLPGEVQKALDFCRAIGNEAVHPGELNLNDSPELAAALFGMLNFVVADRIERPQTIARLYGEIPSRIRGWIDERDGAEKPLAPSAPPASET